MQFWEWFWDSRHRSLDQLFHVRALGCLSIRVKELTSGLVIVIRFDFMGDLALVPSFS